MMKSTVLGDAQPFLWPVTVQVGADGLLPGQVPVDLLSGDVAVGHHEPCVGVGTVGIGGFSERLFPSLCQAIIAASPGVLLPSKVQQNVVHRLPHCGIVRQRFIAEACGGLIWKFLPNGVQVFLGICEGLFFTTGVGDPTHRLCLLGHPLLAQVVGIKVPLIFPRGRGAAQAVAVVLRLRDIAEASAILGDLTAVLIAVVSHRSQIRKGTIRPEHIHKLLKFVFEFPRVELVAVVGPPSVVASTYSNTLSAAMATL